MKQQEKKTSVSSITDRLLIVTIVGGGLLAFGGLLFRVLESFIGS